MLNALSRAVRALARECALPPTDPRTDWSPRAARRHQARRSAYRTDPAGAVRRTLPKGLPR